MSGSLAGKIQAANAAIITDGDLDAIGDYFAPDYVAHGTDRDMQGPDSVRHRSPADPFRM